MAGKAVILESGTANTRAGFALDTDPKVYRRTLVGQTSPIQKGVVTDWNALETLWSEVLMKDLKVNPEEKNVLIVDRPVPDHDARAKMAELLFEKLNVKGLFFGINAVMSLYACGRLAGVVLETGESDVHAVPVNDGYAIPDAVVSLGTGGCGQTDHLDNLLKQQGHNLDAPTVRDIKEKLCYVAKNYKLEMAKSGDADFAKTYNLPDGKTISLGTELAETGELLFQPSTSGGVAALLSKAIGSCDSAIQATLKKNIVLGGGPSTMTGFEERLRKEMNVGQADLIAAPTRLNSAFIGGSILANLDDFQSMWVTRAEYQEKGATVVKEKCK